MLRLGHAVALCALALLVVGVVMVNSALMTVTPASADAPSAPGMTAQSILSSRSVVYMGLALAAMAIASYVPVRRLSAVLGAPEGERQSMQASALVPFALAAGGLLVLLALVYAPIIGHQVNGSHRWLKVPNSGKNGQQMQPSEIAKWALVVVVAWYAARRARVMHRFWWGLIPALAMVGLVSGMVAIEDLGTGALIAAASCLVLLAGGARLWQFAMFIPVGALGIVALLVDNPYRIERIRAFLDPYADPEGSGFHMIQSMIAIANGEGFGRGLGNGLQKFGYLPEDHTDFLFAVLCEELGVAGAGLVLALFLILIWSGIAIARRERDPLLRLATLGVMATVGFQAVINVVVVTGVGPTKGIALPLVSSGGTGWILTCFSLGLVIAVDRTRAAAHAFGSEDLSRAARAASAPPAGALTPALATSAGAAAAPGPSAADPAPARRHPAGAAA